jgi:hypothetical protein
MAYRLTNVPRRGPSRWIEQLAGVTGCWATNPCLVKGKADHSSRQNSGAIQPFAKGRFAVGRREDERKECARQGRKAYGVERDNKDKGQKPR